MWCVGTCTSSSICWGHVKTLQGSQDCTPDRRTLQLGFPEIRGLHSFVLYQCKCGTVNRAKIKAGGIYSKLAELTGSNCVLWLKKIWKRLCINTKFISNSFSLQSTVCYHFCPFFVIEKGRKGEKSGKKNKSKGRLSDDETPKLKKKLKTAAVTP